MTENENHAEEIGLNWAVHQSEELLSANVHGLHYYVLNDGPIIAKILKKLLK